MKRAKQNELMIQKILNNAIEEFNSYDYESASLNRICKKGQISKGIIYHYFKDKDDLYLKCVQICFETLIEYYNQKNFNCLDLSEAVIGYMQIRAQFFEEHTEFRGLFFNVLLRTPSHLQHEVNNLKKELDTINLSFLKNQLSKITLKDSISVDGAVKFLDIQINSFNEYFQKAAEENENFHSVIEKHEDMIVEWLNIILYGIVKEA